MLYIPGSWVIVGRVENQPWWHSVEAHHKSDETIHVTQYHCLMHSVPAPDALVSVMQCCAQLFLQWALLFYMTLIPTMQCDERGSALAHRLVCNLQVGSAAS